VPTPGPSTTIYGGNTPTVELSVSDGDKDWMLVLDAGTGIRSLGNELRASERDVCVDLLITHTHWDHIQGFPFFGPVFDKNSEIRILGPGQKQGVLEEVLRKQMDPVVFPVPLDGVAANLSVTQIEAGSFELSGFEVDASIVRHPGKTFGYRVRGANGGPDVAYVPDNELGPGGDYDVEQNWRKDFVKFLQGTELLIHDAMYLPDELPRHLGWGHSSNIEAVELAVEAGVKRLALFHHRPEHGDETVAAMCDAAKERAASLDSQLEVFAAREGEVLTL